MNYCEDLMGSKPTHYSSQCFKSGHSYTELTGDNCKVQRHETIAFIFCAYVYCSVGVQLVHFLGKECIWVSSMNITSHLGSQSFSSNTGDKPICKDTGLNFAWWLCWQFIGHRSHIVTSSTEMIRKQTLASHTPVEEEDLRGGIWSELVHCCHDD